MIALAFAIIACAALAAYLGHFKDREFWRKIRRIQGKPWLPLIGNIHHIRSDRHGRYLDLLGMWEEMGHSTFHVKIGPDVNVILSTPDCIETIVKHNALIDKPKEYAFFKSWIGDGLLTSTGEKWKRQRRVITPTFHFSILEQYVHVFNTHGDKFIKILRDERGKLLDIFPPVNKCSLDVICDAAMGYQANAQEDGESEFVTAVYEISTILTGRMFSSYKRVQWIYEWTEDCRKEQKHKDTLHRLSTKVIQNRKREMKEEIAAAFASTSSSDLSRHLGDNKHRPFLDLLLLSKLPNGEPLDDVTIKDEVDTFVFEGQDTTTSGIAFTLFMLSRHPDVQNQAFEEQLALFGADLARRPTYADLQAMKYLDRVIKESLRLYPSVPMVARSITEDITLPDGTELPTGSTATLYFVGLHRNPMYYDEPERFNPDRFLQDAVKDNPFLHLPFSAGRRNCIGQRFAILEIKTLVSKVLRHYQLNASGPEHDPKLAAELTLKSINGLHLIVEDRKY